MASVVEERRHKAATEAGSPPLVLKLEPVMSLTEANFHELARLNRDLRLERTARGEIVIMPPAGGRTSNRNANLTMQLYQWAKQDGRGQSFDSSGGFVLPNKAIRSPDASWVLGERLAALDEAEWEKFLPLCPDFVLELRSPSDHLPMLRAKMEEYRDNGARLGWLIDPVERRVEIYRPEREVEVLIGPETVADEAVLPGFVLDLREVW